MRWLLVLALVLLPGCTLLEGEGAEKLVVRNADGRALSIVIAIDQVEGGVRVFGEEVFLDVGEVREYPLALRPGKHFAEITTSTGAAETIPIDIPARGESTIEVLAVRGGATISMRN